jgi:16S rRNA (cytosine967-C5)-methyltransferase
VLLDAPCSGLGTLRRDPDIRWRRTEESLAPLAATQVEMLNRAADVVKAGGRLVYATCSSEPDENEQVVERFLSDRRDFARAPELIQAGLQRFLTPDGDFRTFPFRDQLEAFFAAMLVKTKDLR